MVPRPLLNKEKAHRHIVTCASSTSVTAPRFAIFTDALGNTTFNNTVLGSPNMSINFSLSAMVINLGGVLATTVPMPNANEFQQLYDTFQIEKVEVTVFFGNTESVSSGEPLSNYNYVCPLIGYTVDTDDTASSSILQLQQYSTYKVHQSNSPLKISLVPCPASVVFDPTVAAIPVQLGYSRAQKQDINTQYGSTPHYGVKFAVDAFKAQNGDYQTLFSVQARVHYLMKSTR